MKVKEVKIKVRELGLLHMKASNYGTKYLRISKDDGVYKIIVPGVETIEYNKDFVVSFAFGVEVDINGREYN